MANMYGLAGKGSIFKGPDAKPAGFWYGFWHGLIAPISFVMSLFNDNISTYETANNGKLYELGFIIGFGGISAHITFHHHQHC